MFVLDEADEMLSRGFKEQIYDVFTTMPQSIQVILLSATMPSDVLEVTTKFMNDPIKILVKKEELTLEGIRQFYVTVEREVRSTNERRDFDTTSSLPLGMEVRHAVWFIRNTDNNTSGHLLEHSAKSRLVDRENACPGLHCLSDGKFSSSSSRSWPSLPSMPFDVNVMYWNWPKMEEIDRKVIQRDLSVLWVNKNWLTRPSFSLSLSEQRTGSERLILARWHGPKRTWRDHERISNRFQSSLDHHGSACTWYRCSASQFGHQLRSAEQSRELHPSVSVENQAETKETKARFCLVLVVVVGSVVKVWRSISSLTKIDAPCVTLNNSTTPKYKKCLWTLPIWFKQRRETSVRVLSATPSASR